MINITMVDMRFIFCTIDKKTILETWTVSEPLTLESLNVGPGWTRMVTSPQGIPGARHDSFK